VVFVRSGSATSLAPNEDGTNRQDPQSRDSLDPGTIPGLRMDVEVVEIATSGGTL